MRIIKRTITYSLIAAFLFNGNAFALRPQSSQNRSEAIAKPLANSSLAFHKRIVEVLQSKEQRADLSDFIKNSIKDAPYISTIKSLLDFITTAENYQIGRTLGELGYYQRLDFISDCFSKAFKRGDSQLVVGFLKLLQKEKGMLIEADRLLTSYLAVYEIDRPITVSTVFAMYKGQNKIRPYSEDNRVGQDFLREKVKQLQKLYSINPDINWQIIAVGDGDDSSSSRSGEKTIDVARQIARESLSDLLEAGKLVFLELSEKEKKQIDSVKGGAVCYGMRWAIDHGADYCIYTDGDLSSHLSQEGLLLKETVLGSSDVAIGSINMPESFVPKREFKRVVFSAVYRFVAKLILPELRRVTDTQRSFKCYSKEVLNVILPVGKHRNFEKDFIYNFSFDTNLLARARLGGFKIDQRAIVWVDFPYGSTIRRWDFIPMLLGLIKQRILLTFHSRKYKRRAKEYRNYLMISQARVESISRSMEGSTKAQELFFKDVPVRKKIRKAIASYDLGTLNPLEVEFENLPGVPKRPPLLIKTPRGKFVIKFVSDTLDGARFIVSAIRHASEKGMPTANLLRMNNSESDNTDSYILQLRDDYYAVVKEYLEGEIRSRETATTEEMAELGRFLADFHNKVFKYIPEGKKHAKRTIDVADYLSQLEETEKSVSDYWMGMYMEDLERARTSYEPQTAFSGLLKGEQLMFKNGFAIMQEMRNIREFLPFSEYEKLPKSLIAGDINFNNVIFNPEGEISGFFDWDKARLQARLEDFKNPIMGLSQGKGRIYDTESAIAMILAYQISSDSPLNIDELKALPEVFSSTFLWTLCSYFLLQMDRLNRDPYFYDVAEKDIEQFKLFLDDKELLRYVLINLSELIGQFHIERVSDIDSNLIENIISSQKRSFEQVSRDNIRQSYSIKDSIPTDITSMILIYQAA